MKRQIERRDWFLVSGSGTHLCRGERGSKVKEDLATPGICKFQFRVSKTCRAPWRPSKWLAAAADPLKSLPPASRFPKSIQSHVSANRLCICSYDHSLDRIVCDNPPRGVKVPHSTEIVLHWICQLQESTPGLKFQWVPCFSFSNRLHLPNLAIHNLFSQNSPA